MKFDFDLPKEEFNKRIDDEIKLCEKWIKFLEEEKIKNEQVS